MTPESERVANAVTTKIAKGIPLSISILTFEAIYLWRPACFMSSIDLVCLPLPSGPRIQPTLQQLAEMTRSEYTTRAMSVRVITVVGRCTVSRPISLRDGLLEMMASYNVERTGNEDRSARALRRSDMTLAEQDSFWRATVGGTAIWSILLVWRLVWI